MCSATDNFRTRRHNVIVKLVTSYLQEAGFLTREEAHIPQWRRMWKGKSQAAILDILGTCHPTLPDHFIDVTVRHPGADGYSPGASKERGFAAAAACVEKHTRYPDLRGKKVSVAAIEVFGQMAP